MLVSYIIGDDISGQRITRVEYKHMISTLFKFFFYLDG
jgi:hypothetical protein